MRIGGVIRRAVLIVLGAIWLVPVYLLLVNAFRPGADYTGDHVWTPSATFGLFDNFAKAWDNADLGPSIGSTVLYSVVSPAVGVVVGALAAYAIVVLRLRHGFAWFLAVYGGTIFPTQMLLIPLFLGYSDTNLYDNRFGMVLIYTTISVPLAAFVMRNFFTGVAYEVFEAARIDGASVFTAFWRIYLPLSVPALAAVFILDFTFVWNDLMFGLTLSQDQSVRPIQTALSALNSAYAGTSVPTVLAAGLIVSLPTVALFLATQRLFARGLTLGQY
ncbi:carbohydrate ABC transporter permease [Actinocatenispora rupis]|uniref:Permease n=1 Tax=Actinocatenispora rupis TaxID=519421 RepID=A0A8J3NAA1_9ACTN|nr:carbohydrate ABC transporter permease [Actinocatenispora rupis]GID09500.1 permease [Actinocatenispora rupis]